MTTSKQNPDGTWAPAQPLQPTADLDFEVKGTGPFTWEALRGTTCVASGSARTRLGLQVALLKARRKHATDEPTR